MSEMTLAARLEPDLVDRLHKSLRIADKTAVQIAAELGVHRNTVARYLKGRAEPDRRTLMAWAMACGVPVRWLEFGVVPDGPDGGGWAPWGSNPQPTDCVSSLVRPLRSVAA